MSYPDYYVGVDLGQSMDYTAICVLEEPVWIASEELAWKLVTNTHGWVSPALLTPYQRTEARRLESAHERPGKPVLAARHVERLPLNTSYPAIVAHVAALLRQEPLAGSNVALVVDRTGVGRPVTDLFREAGFAPIAVTITGGDAITHEDGYGVPKRDLISTVAVLLENHRLQIAASLPDAATLTRELSAFRRRVTRAGNDTYEAWREKDHDDLVLALALAAWYREWWCERLNRAGKSYVFDRFGKRTA